MGKKKAVKTVGKKATKTIQKAKGGRDFGATKGGYRGDHCLRCGKVQDKCERSNCPGV